MIIWLLVNQRALRGQRTAHKKQESMAVRQTGDTKSLIKQKFRQFRSEYTEESLKEGPTNLFIQF